MMADGPDASIVLFGDGQDWHGRSLRARLQEARDHAADASRSTACGFSTETTTGLAIPDLGDPLPKGAFVRFVPGGSFEEVTLYLGVLHALRELGVTVWNDARAIERCVDKSTTTFFLQRDRDPDAADLRLASIRDEARAIAAARARARGKSSCRSRCSARKGKGLRLIATPADLAPPEEVNGVYYLQEFVPPAQAPSSGLADLRVPGRVVASMIRHGTSWITNIKQGARAKAAIASAGADRSRGTCGVLRRRRLCRGRHHPGADGRFSRARGELDAGVEWACSR